MTPNGTGQGEYRDSSAWSKMREMEERIEKLEREVQRLDRILERVVTQGRPK